MHGFPSNPSLTEIQAEHRHTCESNGPNQWRKDGSNQRPYRRPNNHHRHGQTFPDGLLSVNGELSGGVLNRCFGDRFVREDLRKFSHGCIFRHGDLLLWRLGFRFAGWCHHERVKIEAFGALEGLLSENVVVNHRRVFGPL